MPTRTSSISPPCKGRSSRAESKPKGRTNDRRCRDREQAGQGRGRRTRVGIVTTLIVVATIVGILGSFAVWSARQILETEQWEETSTKLLEDDDIRAALGGFLVDSLFESVDVQGEIASALPPRLAPLAGPAAGGIRQLAEQRAPIFLARPKVQELWQTINKAAHERFLKVVEGEAPALSESGGAVYLDLGVVVQQLGAQLGIGAAAKVPTGVAQLDIMDADQLDTAKNAVKLLKGVAYVLFVVWLLLLALAVYLAAGWRRRAIRSAGFSMIVIGAVVLVGQNLAGSVVVDALAATPASEPAVDSTWTIATSFLSGIGVAMIGYGIAIIIGAWLAGPGAISSAVRRSITPFLRDRRILYPILLVIVLLVYMWSPTEGTQRVIPSLVLIALLVGGAEALRRQVREEFPDATMDAHSERWRVRMESVRDRGQARLQRGGGGSADAPAASPAEDRISQLERLAELHKIRRARRRRAGPREGTDQDVAPRAAQPATAVPLYRPASRRRRATERRRASRCSAMATSPTLIVALAGSAASPAATRSNRSSAAARSAPVSEHANSSPPSRTSHSPGSSSSVRATPTEWSSSSPEAWPCASFLRLRPSMSMNARQRVDRSRRWRSSSCSSANSPTPLRRAPVSSSIAARCRSAADSARF